MRVYHHGPGEILRKWKLRGFTGRQIVERGKENRPTEKEMLREKEREEPEGISKSQKQPN